MANSPLKERIHLTPTQDGWSGGGSSDGSKAHEKGQTDKNLCFIC